MDASEQKNIDIGKEIKKLANVVMRGIESRPVYKEVSKTLSGTNGWIIGYIASNMDKDVFQKDLEREFSITRSTASKVVDLLVEKGFVERRSVDYDKRLKKLVLTQKSIDIHNVIKEDKAEMCKIITKGFSNEELKQFVNYMERIKDNLTE